MLHHVSVEIDPAQVEACVACWQLLGFEPIAAPAALGEYFTWLERRGTQIHLIHSEQPTVPPLGHAAVAVEDFEAAFAALERAGHEPERHRELWGQPRAFVTMPGGHRVELMAAPPSVSFVAVAGSIAVGKTGLVTRLAEALGATALREDVSQNPYFDRFYEDPERWAFHSQVAFAADSLERHARASGLERVVQDRTIHEAVDVFGRLLNELGDLDAEELRILLDLREGARSLPRQPTLMVYLHAEPETLLERVVERGRPAERHLTVDYLQRLQARYEEFIGRWSGCPVLEVDTGERDLRDEAELQRLVGELRSVEEV